MEKVTALRPLFLLPLRLAIGGYFLYAGIQKILDPATFANQVKNYGVLPREAIHPFALALPWMEALAGGSLITGLAARGAALVIGGLTVLFIAALVQALLRGLNIACGCFGASLDAPIHWKHVAENVVILIGCLTLLVHDRYGATWRLGGKEAGGGAGGG